MKIALTSGQRNESKYIAEWLSWYLIQGVDKFIVYNHQSDDNTEAIYKELRNHYDIELYYIEGNNCHYPMQQHFLDNYRPDFDWLMCHIDPDEYMVASDANKTIRDVLWERWEMQQSALGVYWCFYGDNGHVEDPSMPTIQAYTKRSEISNALNHHMKSIVRGRGRGGSIAATNPHVYTTEFGTIDLEGRPILPHQGWNQGNPASHDIMRINHYWPRSYEWFKKVKQPRGYRWDRPESDPTSNVSEQFWRSQNFNDVEDTAIWDQWGDKFMAKLDEVRSHLTIEPNLFTRLK
jgi:hypothetical protein